MAAYEQQLAEHAEWLRRFAKRTVCDIIEAGERLKKAKQLCGHGRWLPWLKQFGWTEATALNFMRVSELALKSPAVVDLSIPFSGLYLLAAPSTPDEAREAVIEAAAGGERITYAEVKTAVRGGKDYPGRERVFGPPRDRRRAVKVDDEPEPEPEPASRQTESKPLDLTAQAHAALTRVTDLIRQMTQRERTDFRQQASERVAAAMRDEPDVVFF
jgi:hypothetical protein